MSEEKVLKMKKNTEKISDLRKDIEKTRKIQDENVSKIEENNLLIKEIKKSIERNNEAIKEAIELKKQHEKNIKFKRKHRILNKISGFFHVIGFPTYSVKNSLYEIKMLDEKIIELEKNNEKNCKKMLKIEDENMTIFEENSNLAEKVDKILEEITNINQENSLICESSFINKIEDQNYIVSEKEVPKKELKKKS